MRGHVAEQPGGVAGVTSIFIFISGATLLVYSAERLIGSLVGVSRQSHRLRIRPVAWGVSTFCGGAWRAVDRTGPVGAPLGCG